jgi:hypothetical protein
VNIAEFFLLGLHGLNNEFVVGNIIPVEAGVISSLVGRRHRSFFLNGIDDHLWLVVC